MVPRKLILLALLLLPVSAHAADPVSVTQLCQELVAYQPADDVEYKPGVDVHGNGVVPADLADTPQLDIPETISVLITVNQAQQLGLPANIPYNAEAFVGQVTVNKNGDTYFNGKRISQTQVQALCKDGP